MLEQILDSISNISIGLTIITGSISLLLLNFVDKRIKFLCLYFVVIAAIEIYSFSIAKGQNNLYLYHFYTFFEFLLLSKAFQYIYHQKGLQFNMNLILVPVLIFFLTNSIFFQRFDQYNSYSNILASILIIAYCIYYFYLILDDDRSNEYNETFIKWTLTAVFLYQITMIIFNLFSNFLAKYGSFDSDLMIWLIRALILLSIRFIFVYHITKLSVITLKTQAA